MEPSLREGGGALTAARPPGYPSATGPHVVTRGVWTTVGISDRFTEGGFRGVGGHVRRWALPVVRRRRTRGATPVVEAPVSALPQRRHCSSAAMFMGSVRTSRAKESLKDRLLSSNATKFSASHSGGPMGRAHRL